MSMALPQALSKSSMAAPLELSAQHLSTLQPRAWPVGSWGSLMGSRRRWPSSRGSWAQSLTNFERCRYMPQECLQFFVVSMFVIVAIHLYRSKTGGSADLLCSTF